MAAWLCACGARNAATHDHCEDCGNARPAERRGEAKAAEKKTCGECGEGFEFWTSLIPGDDGQRRCATCHGARLGRFVAAPTDRCGESGCTLTVAEHIAERKRAMAEYARQCLVQTERTPTGGVQL